MASVRGQLPEVGDGSLRRVLHRALRRARNRRAAKPPQLFLFAGTQHVVAALWDVDSLLVSEFMKKLYAQIRSGIAIEIAMRRSMLSIRQKKE